MSFHTIPNIAVCKHKSLGSFGQRRRWIRGKNPMTQWQQINCYIWRCPRMNVIQRCWRPMISLSLRRSRKYNDDDVWEEEEDIMIYHRHQQLNLQHQKYEYYWRITFLCYCLDDSDIAAGALHWQEGAKKVMKILVTLTTRLGVDCCYYCEED